VDASDERGFYGQYPPADNHLAPSGEAKPSNSADLSPPPGEWWFVHSTRATIDSRSCDRASTRRQATSGPPARPRHHKGQQSRPCRCGARCLELWPANKTEALSSVVIACGTAPLASSGNPPY